MIESLFKRISRATAAVVVAGAVAGNPSKIVAQENTPLINESVEKSPEMDYTRFVKEMRAGNFEAIDSVLSHDIWFVVQYLAEEKEGIELFDRVLANGKQKLYPLFNRPSFVYILWKTLPKNRRLDSFLEKIISDPDLLLLLIKHWNNRIIWRIINDKIYVGKDLRDLIQSKFYNRLLTDRVFLHEFIFSNPSSFLNTINNGLVPGEILEKVFLDKELLLELIAKSEDAIFQVLDFTKYDREIFAALGDRPAYFWNHVVKDVHFHQLLNIMIKNPVMSPELLGRLFNFPIGFRFEKAAYPYLMIENYKQHASLKEKLGRTNLLAYIEHVSFADALAISERLESGKMELELKDLMVRNLLRSIKERFDDTKSGVVGDIGDFNQLMRIINNLHGGENTHLRAIIVDSLSMANRFLLVKYGVSELYTSTSSFTNYILPAIRSDIEKLGSFATYKRHLETQGVSSGLEELVTAIARHRELDKFMKYIDHNSTVSLLENVFSFQKDELDSPTRLAEKINSIVELMIALKKANLLIEPFEKKVLSMISAEEISSKMRTVSLAIYTIYDYVIDEDFSKRLNLEGRNAPKKLPVSDSVRITGEQVFSKEKDGRLVHTSVMPCLEGGDGDGHTSCRLTSDALERQGYKKKGFKDGTTLLYKRSIDGKREVRVYLKVIAKNPGLEKNLSDMTDNLEKDAPVHSFVYRGHSTYVPDISNALSNMKRKISPAVLILGSCGGTSSIFSFQKEFSGKVSQVLATAGTGTISVNIPALSEMYSMILEHGNIDSRKWQNAVRAKSSNNKALSGYQFPHENIAAKILSLLEE